MTAELNRRIIPIPQEEPQEISPINVKGNPVPLTLYDALQIGYTRNEDKQESELQKFGFNLDRSLTNYDHLTAFNPETKKLLYVVNGTDPTRVADILTDVSLMFGGLKKTKRYKSDKRDYDAAKAKYDKDRITIAGHSLGGNITSKLDTGDNVDIFNFNSANTFGEKINAREHSFRTNDDLVSILKPKHHQLHTVNQKIVGLPILAPHDIKNIKSENIFI